MEELEIIDEMSIATFLRRWYGDPDRKSVDIAPHFQMPRPLRDWYRLTSQWSIPVCSYNDFSAPGELRFDSGKLIFLDGHQGARVWATEPLGDDPLVYESEYDVDGDWESTGFTLSRFLLYVAVSEAVHGNQGALVSLDLTYSEYKSIAGCFRQLADPLWRYPKADWGYMTGDGLLAYGGPEAPGASSPETYWIIVSANHPRALDKIPLEPFE